MHTHRTTKRLSWFVGALLLAALAVSCKQNVDTSKRFKEITLTFNLAGGTIDGKMDSVQIKGKYGEVVTKPVDPKKDGYVFGGWNPQLSEKFPAEDAIYTAQWEKVYTSTFTVEGTPFNGTLIATLDGKEIDTGVMVAEGKIVEFTASPRSSNYDVNTWTITGSAFIDGTGSEGNTTARVKITAATTVKVTFSPHKKVAFTD